MGRGARPAVPGTIGQELRHNPFMRVGRPTVLAAVGETDPVRCLAAVRARKDQF